MRIAMVCPYFKPIPPEGYGGIERVVSTLTEALVERGHAVMLYAPLGSRTNAMLQICGAEGLRERLAGWEADVIHDHAPHDGRSPVRDSPPWPALSTYHCKDYTGHARNVVCLSRAQRDGLGPAMSESPVIPIPVDPDLYPLTDGKGGYALFMGLMAPWKGPHRAILAAREAGIRIVLAGPKAEPFFSREVAPLLDSDAEYVGEVGGQRRLDLLGGAVALLMPNSDESDWQEPGATVVSEAGACGTPTLAFANGCLPEIVTGENGQICKDTDDMAGCITMAKRGIWKSHEVRQATLERFAAGRIAWLYEELYSLVAEGRTWN